MKTYTLPAPGWVASSPVQGTAPVPLTLPVTLLERVGYPAAWGYLSGQLAARYTVPEGVVPVFEPGWLECQNTRPLLWYLVEDDPTMLARVAWSPQEYRVARALLDRAVAWHLEAESPGTVPVTETGFWSGGRHLAVMVDRRVPVAALPWLATGNWDATVVPPSPLRVTVTTDADGSQAWHQDGRLHRDDGPAFTGSHGRQEWYRDGKLHRDDGPACTWADGSQDWYRDDKLHRDDGPARTRADGSQDWYRDGKLHRGDRVVPLSRS